MPGLLRGIARTAVVAGTATAVAGRVQRHQAEKFADRDADIMSQREQAYYDQQQPAPQQQQQAYAQPAYQEPAAPPPEAAPAADPIQQLKDLAELKNQGILTEEEFSQQKAKILNS